MSTADREYENRIVDPEIRRFVEYWRANRGDAKYPARAVLDPLEFRYVLGDVVLIEAHRSAAGNRQRWDFRYRLIGSNVNRARRLQSDQQDP